MKINNRRELQNNAINHSADINYKDVMKIYRECAKESYNFLTVDTTLPASDHLRFLKKWFDFYKNDINLMNLKLFTTKLKQIKLNMI